MLYTQVTARLCSHPIRASLCDHTRWCSLLLQLRLGGHDHSTPVFAHGYRASRRVILDSEWESERGLVVHLRLHVVVVSHCLVNVLKVAAVVVVVISSFCH